jgi:hypothetical protein
VIEAAQSIALDPTGGELHAAMRAARLHQKYFAGLAAIEREILAHDAQRHRAAGFQIDAVIDRLPEPPQIAARGRAGRA